LDVPNTAANQAAFGGPTDGAFPQIRLIAHCEIGTRALLDASFDTYATSEKALCERLAASVAPDMLTVFDSAFCASDLYSTNTAANHAAFRGPTDGDFRQIRLIAHCEIGTRALIDASFDTYATSEKALCERLAASFALDMLTVFDSGFCGSDLYSTITATGPQVIMRAGAQFDLTPITVLSDGSYTAHLKKGGPLVRVIEYTIYTDTESAHGHQSTVGETI